MFPASSACGAALMSSWTCVTWPPQQLVCSLDPPAVHHAMPIAPEAVAPQSFAGGQFGVNFSIPADITAQLEERSRAYPINWTTADKRATWLAPSRLLLNVFIESPSDSLVIGATLDGEAITLAKAYNSRGLVRSRCFLGFYYDASSLLPKGGQGQQHELVLQLPSLPAGAFKGAFWGNVETAVATGALVKPPTCT